jgi:hypothetical protein
VLTPHGIVAAEEVVIMGYGLASTYAMLLPLKSHIH